MQSKKLSFETLDGQFLELFITPACLWRYLFVNLWTLSEAAYTDWTTRYHGLIVGTPGPDKLVTVDPRAMVEMQRLGQITCIDWLIENQKLIDFTASWEYIRCHHSIEGALADTLQNAAVLDTWLYGDLITEIDRIGGVGCYKNTIYEKYVFFEEDATGIRVDVRPYEADRNCFSFPFLKGITRENRDIALAFKPVRDTDGSTVMTFTLVGSGTNALYFNFSHIPPNP